MALRRTRFPFSLVGEEKEGTRRRVRLPLPAAADRQQDRPFSSFLASMSVIYSIVTFAEIIALFASFVALVYFAGRAIVRALFGHKVTPPKPEDLRHLKRAGQSGFY